MRVRCRGGDGEDREQMPACVEDVHRASKEAAARGRLELRQLGAGAKLQLARRAGVARGGAHFTYAKGCKKSGVGGLQSFNFWLLDFPSASTNAS